VTGTRLDYEEDPDGKICVERIDPLMFFWDASAAGRNINDRRWDATIKLIDHEELEQMFGEDKVEGLALDDDIWRDFLLEGESVHNADPWMAYRNNTRTERKSQRVPLVEYEYYKREPYYRVFMPTGQEELSYGEFRDVKSSLDASGIRYVRQTRRKFYRCFLAGNVILENGPSPCETHFSRTPMTGKRDESVSSWYGMVRPMIGTEDTQGPQQLANKLYTEAVSSIASQGKGGLLAESDAFDDVRDAEEQWASADSIIWMRPGGINKVTPKPLGEYPQGMDRLLQWAVQSVPEVTGVNWELLGLVNRDQPGIVEDSRRQAAITILAEYFDSLKLYRTNLGRLLAYLVSEYMAGETPEDSQLIRLAGQGKEEIVPLLKDQLVQKYDVIVDEAPSSASQKDKTWSVLIDLLPMAMQLGMPPPPNFLEYAPIPQALAESWLQALQQQAEAQQNPAMDRMMAAEAAKSETQAQLNVAKVQESVAKAAKTTQEAQLAPAELQLKTFQAMKPQQPTPEVNNGRTGTGE